MSAADDWPPSGPTLGCPAELAGLLAGPQALAEQEEFLR